MSLIKVCMPNTCKSARQIGKVFGDHDTCCRVNKLCQAPIFQQRSDRFRQTKFISNEQTRSIFNFLFTHILILKEQHLLMNLSTLFRFFSALVHSFTLVTAGVYLLIRFHRIVGIRISLFYIGVLTMFISGLGANLERDLKKIIALSTLSPLGLIIIAVSLRIVVYAFFHLITHEIFKSLLFLCAGEYIHSIGDTQDIRHISGFSQGCPITSLYFIISSIALIGLLFYQDFIQRILFLKYI
jgi:hypothetical protein